MNFFEQQEAARRSTKKLVVLFTTAVIGICLFVFGGVAVSLYWLDGGPQTPGELAFWWKPELMVYTAGPVFVLIALVTLIKTMQLAQGGHTVADMMGCTLVLPGTNDAQERRLLNVVEEMAIASGVGVPQVYVLEGTGINAFAAGYQPEDAIVAVTRGALDALNREELQGVIAHEFSHILNGDMRLNIRLLGTLAGIMALAQVGGFFMRLGFQSSGSSHRRRKGKVSAQLALLIFGAFLWLVGAFGVFTARLIQSAVSRQREFLADASAVQFTRSTSGIGGALQKILDSKAGSLLDVEDAGEVAHFCIASPLGFSWFETHPPIEERIRRITGLQLQSRERTGFPDSVPISQAPVSALTTSGESRDWASITGSIDHEALHFSRDILSRLPEGFYEETGTSLGSLEICLAIMVRGQVREFTPFLKSHLDARFVERVFKKGEVVELLSLSQRTALLELSVRSLRMLTPVQARKFVSIIEAGIRLDELLTIEEVCLLTMVEGAIASSSTGTPRQSTRRQDHYSEATSVVLSALAYCGGADFRSAQTYLMETLDLLPRDLRRKCKLSSPEHASGQELVRSMRRLRTAPLDVRRAVLDAAANIVLKDNLVTPEERGLFRALALTFQIPIPVNWSSTRKQGGDS